MRCSTAWGQRAVVLLQCTASLPGGTGQMNSCNRLPHCLEAVGSGPSAMHCPTAWVQWAVHFCNALPHCLKALGSGTPAVHCLTA